MPPGFPVIKDEKQWIGIRGDILQAADPSVPETLKRGVQRKPSGRQMAFMLGREKPVSKDRTDETLGEAQVIRPMPRNMEVNRKAGRELLGGRNAAEDQTPQTNEAFPHKRVVPILKGQDTEIQRVVRSELDETADQKTEVHFLQDKEEFVPETRSAHEIAAKEVASLRAAGLQASMGDFRIAHSGIDTLVPLGEHEDKESRELMWKIFKPTTAPFTVAATSMDVWLTSRLSDEIQTIRHSSGIGLPNQVSTVGATTIHSGTVQHSPLEVGTSKAYADIYKTLSTMTAHEFREDPLTLAKAGGWALSVLEASGHPVASLKTKGIEALGRVALGLLDIKSADEVKEFQGRDDINPSKLPGVTQLTHTSPSFFDLRDAMKDDTFRTAFMALQDAATFYEPVDVIVGDLTDLLRREDPLCSNERSADLLNGIKDAEQSHVPHGKDRVSSTRTSQSIGDTNAKALRQPKRVSYVDKFSTPPTIGEEKGFIAPTAMKREILSKDSSPFVVDTPSRDSTRQSKFVYK